MLSLELIAILGLLFAFVVYVMVVTQLERRSLRIADKQAAAEKRAQATTEPVTMKVER
jgi:uncharacterized protein YpmS